MHILYYSYFIYLIFIFGLASAFDLCLYQGCCGTGKWGYTAVCGGVLCKGGSPAPPRRMQGKEDHAGDTRHYPAASGTRHTRGGSPGGKLILKFPSCEIEAHVPIMKYFLPFHGSSVIPDGREPGKTDPPRSHPRRLTARAGTNKGFVLPGRRGSPPPAWTPYSILQTRPLGEPFAPFSLLQKSEIRISKGILEQGCSSLPRPHPQVPHVPYVPRARQAACRAFTGDDTPANSRCFNLFFELCGFSSSSKFN